MKLNNIIKNKISTLPPVVGKTFSFTPEETIVEDLAKASVLSKYFILLLRN